MTANTRSNERLEVPYDLGLVDLISGCFVRRLKDVTISNISGDCTTFALAA